MLNQLIILIVEDTPYDYRLVKRAIENSAINAELVWVQRGEEALEKLEESAYDIMLLDYNLLGMTGLETFRQMNEATNQCPVIFITGTGNESVAVEALKMGASDYLVKDNTGNYLQLVPLVISKAHHQWQAKQEHHHIQEALRLSEERYALASRGANDGLWDWNLESQQVYYSSRWKQMIGYEETEIGNSVEEWLGRVHPYDIESLRSALQTYWESFSPHFEHEYRLLHRDDRYHWMRCRGVAVWNRERKVQRMVGSQTDITEQKEAEAKLYHNAYHDVLTELPNRALFMDRLQRAMARGWQTQRMFAIAYLDVDGFKQINDSLGHFVGDQLLVAAARRLEECIRPTDLLARLGGDEFSLFLDNINDNKAGVLVVERILKSLLDPFLVEGHTLFVSASIGLCFSSPHYKDPLNMIRDADMAMYQAKRKGKARYAIFDQSQHSTHITYWQMTQDLRQALQEKSFQIHYQPIVDSKSQKIVGAEALIRWQHPEQGLIAPDKFIPIAEETGWIVPLSEWIIHEACQQLQAWQKQGFPDLTMAINLSYRQFQEQNLTYLIPMIVDQYDIPYHCLQLEITESLSVRQFNTSFDALYALQKLGFQISIDDFGLGSSFSCLATFPLDILKIDQSFVREWTPENKKNEAIIIRLIQLAHDLGLRVIAEGVEEEAQLKFLQAQGADYIQGYFFSRPVEAPKFEALLSLSP